MARLLEGVECMAAALRRNIEQSPTRRRSRRVGSLRAVQQEPPVLISAVKRPAAIAAALKTPLWLRLLSGLYQSTTVLSGGLLLATLVLYGCTVYVDKSVQAGRQRLEGLRRSHQQLTTASEVLKQHLAQQAEAPGAALELPQPNGLIFLAPADSKASDSAPELSPQPVPQSLPEAIAAPTRPPFSQPLGY
ncbi:MAG: hypothetical protein HC816_14940 [Leptolyngbyaceae cyanobacterium RM1_1_2]|nr:hypothetical protein [Leptolyngbyaceae cyanobacterium RM1_1_2]